MQVSNDSLCGCEKTMRADYDGRNMQDLDPEINISGTPAKKIEHKLDMLNRRVRQDAVGKARIFYQFCHAASPPLNAHRTHGLKGPSPSAGRRGPKRL
jgi:hypothetical protein